jgi:hypothetical protein
LCRLLELHLLLVGLQVDPLPLRHVQVVEDLVEVGQLVLPNDGPVAERLVVRRTLDRLQQNLVVADLCGSRGRYYVQTGIAIIGNFDHFWAKQLAIYL